jgi:hypothetical protein
MFKILNVNDHVNRYCIYFVIDCISNKIVQSTTHQIILPFHICFIQYPIAMCSGIYYICLLNYCQLLEMFDSR